MQRRLGRRRLRLKKKLVLPFLPRLTRTFEGNSIITAQASSDIHANRRKLNLLQLTSPRGDGILSRKIKPVCADTCALLLQNTTQDIAHFLTVFISSLSWAFYLFSLCSYFFKLHDVSLTSCLMHHICISFLYLIFIFILSSLELKHTCCAVPKDNHSSRAEAELCA